MPNPASNILIVRPTALGDVSRTVPCLAMLRQAHPQANIDWLVHDGFVDVVRHHPMLTSVIPFPRKLISYAWRSPSGFKELIQWSLRLRRRKYDLVIDLQGLLRSGVVCAITGAPRRVGYANAREMGWFFYNRRHHVQWQTHAVDRMVGLLTAEGYAPDYDMRLYTSQPDRDWAQQQLSAAGLEQQGFFIVAPTAQWLCKCWPVEQYAQTTRRLILDGRAGAGAVVLAGPNERDTVERLTRMVDLPGKLIAPPTSVGQMMALIQRAKLVLCNDSAALHIAIGFDRPVVTLFGPTDPALVGPFRRPDSVVRPPDVDKIKHFDYRRYRDDQSLIAQITAQQVWDRIQATTL